MPVEFGKRVGGPAPRPVLVNMTGWTRSYIETSQEFAAMARRLGELELAAQFEAQAERAQEVGRQFGC